MADLICPHDSVLAQRRKPMALERDGQGQPFVCRLEEEQVRQLRFTVVSEDVAVVPELLNDLV